MDQANLDQIRRTLDVFLGPGQITNLRAFREKKDDAAVSVVTADREEVVRKAEIAEHLGCRGVYFTPNPAMPEAILARTVDDALILSRRWLLLDADPVRYGPDGAPLENQIAPSSEEERAAAWSLLNQCRETLENAGLFGCLVGDSGNGWHLCYPYDAANDEASYDDIAALYRGLNDRFGGPRARIDQTTKDAPRIWKLYGTMTRKGIESPGRPYRRSCIVSVEDAPPMIGVVNQRRLAGLLERWHAEERERDRARKADAEDKLARARTYIIKEPPAISGQGGHARTFHVACIAVQGFDLSDGEALQAMADWNAGLKEQWTEAELMHKITDARESHCDKEIGYLLREDRSLNFNFNGHYRNGHKNGHQPKSLIGPRPTGGGEKKEPTWQLYLDDEQLAEGDNQSSPDLGEEKTGPKRVSMLSLGRLLATELPPPVWVVPGILSEGLNILAGAPKQGKSMLALNLALTVAGGGKAMGSSDVEVGDVLYLSLEDKTRRVQSRAVAMLRGLHGVVQESASARLSIATDWERQDRGGLAMIAAWATKAPNPKLLIIDVWNRYAPFQRTNGSAYTQDADAMAEVKRLAEKLSFTALVIHHTRKPASGKEPDDFVQEVNGTMGLSGAADGILVLLRSRHEHQATLHITGRDTTEQQLVLEFVPDTLTWRSMGTTEHHLQGKVQQAIVAFLKSRADVGASAPEVAEAIKEKPDSVRRALGRMLQDKIVSKKGNIWRWPFADHADQSELVDIPV